MSNSATEWAFDVGNVVMSSRTPAIAWTICCNRINFSCTNHLFLKRMPNGQQSHSLA